MPDIGFLDVELMLIGLLFIGLLSGSASQVAAVDLLLHGKFAIIFWVNVIAIGILIPLVL